MLFYLAICMCFQIPKLAKIIFVPSIQIWNCMTFLAGVGKAPVKYHFPNWQCVEEPWINSQSSPVCQSKYSSLLTLFTCLTGLGGKTRGRPCLINKQFQHAWNLWAFFPPCPSLWTLPDWMPEQRKFFTLGFHHRTLPHPMEKYPVWEEGTQWMGPTKFNKILPTCGRFHHHCRHTWQTQILCFLIVHKWVAGLRWVQGFQLPMFHPGQQYRHLDPEGLPTNIGEHAPKANLSCTLVLAYKFGAILNTQSFKLDEGQHSWVSSTTPVAVQSWVALNRPWLSCYQSYGGEIYL